MCWITSFLGNITDIALIQSLSALQLGRQYVAINEHACEKIRIEKEVPLSHLERVCLQEVSEQNRSKGVSQPMKYVKSIVEKDDISMKS